MGAGVRPLEGVQAPRMPSLELSGSSLAGSGHQLEKQQEAAADSGARRQDMQPRTRTMARGNTPQVHSGQQPQQDHQQQSPPQQQQHQQHLVRTTSRSNPKLKVLTRSHAMREETSPPREPSPPAPRISIITSPPPTSPPPPASTNTMSVQLLQDNRPQECDITSTDTDADASIAIEQHDNESAVTNKISISDSVKNNSSPSQTSNQKSSVKIIDRTKNEQTNYICDCVSQVCAKCKQSEQQERNINNNLPGSSNNNNNTSAVSTGGASCASGAVGKDTLSVRAAGGGRRLRQQGSSQESSTGTSPSPASLSRDSSTEHYTDCTGIDLHQFIIDTLNKNAKDRVMMLKIEQELVTLAKDKSKTHYKFPAMSSYQRMLVHRCAAYFGMEHNIETSGKCVVVNKTRNTRVPERRFREHIREDVPFGEEPRRSILKRDSSSFEDCRYKSPDRGHLGLESRRSKSFEEREEEYEKVRRRIFKDGTMHEWDSHEDFVLSEIPWPDADTSKIRLLPPDQPILKNRLLKVQSMDGRSDGPMRPCVAKSYSFGGYGGSVSVLSRGDSVTSTHSAGPRLLTKQDSSTSTISWRLSPSSSGYKSQSQRSDSVTPSPTATPHPDLGSGKSSLEEQCSQDRPPLEQNVPDRGQVVWAVSHIGDVPKGVMLIDPATLRPYTNQDGSVYHHDPSNPLPGLSSPTASKPPPSPVKNVATSPRKSPVKEQQSPVRSKNRKGSPAKTKINSATSPSLPPLASPPVPQPPPPAHQPAAPAACYGQPPPAVESQGNMMQPYPTSAPLYSATAESYQQVMYPAAAPCPYQQQYDSRPDSAVSDMSGYFVNMAIGEPPQPVTFAQPQYWTTQQQQAYYQPPPPPPPPPKWQQTTAYLPTYVQGYAPSGQMEPMPVYGSPMYPSGGQQTPGPAPGSYIQSPAPVLYAPQPALYQQQQPPPQQTYPVYPGGAPAPGYSPAVQQHCYTAAGAQIAGYEQSPGRVSRAAGKGKPPAGYGRSCGSAHSSGGSSSPANTVISGYFPQGPPPAAYRQCTPPETPPTHTMPPFTYPPPPPPQAAQQYHQQHTAALIYRPMGSIRASPPVNVRGSRSPTPAPEYPPPGTPVDRAAPGQRFSIYGLPCIVPGDMRALQGGRAQPPPPTAMYKQQQPQPPPYRTHSYPAAPGENNRQPANGHRPRKPRAKVPSLAAAATARHQPQPVTRY